MGAIQRGWLVVAVVVALSRQAAAAEPPPIYTEPAPAFTLVADTDVGKKLEKARDLIADKKWEEACTLLQEVLDLETDVIVLRKGKLGSNVYVNASDEAEKLLRDMPPDGHKVYQWKYGEKAQDLIDEWKKKKDIDLLRQVVRRFADTPAEDDALPALVHRLAVNGAYVPALRYYDRVSASRWEEVSSEAVFYLVAGVHRLGLEDRWLEKQLRERAKSGLQIGDRKLKAGDVARELGKAVAAGSEPVETWPVYGGSLSRSAQGKGGTPFLDPLYQQPVVRQTAVKDLVLDLYQRREAVDRQMPVLPGMFPVTAVVKTDKDTIPLLVFRSYFGVHAVDMRTGKLVLQPAGLSACRGQARRDRQAPREVLAELLSKDFKKNEALLKEFRDSCQVEDPDLREELRAQENRERLLVYHTILAKGRLAQGKLEEVLDTYLEMAALGDRDELRSNPDDPGLMVSTPVWLRGRIEALLKTEDRDLRGKLEDRLAKEWADVRKTKKTARMREFAAIISLKTEFGKTVYRELVEHMLNDPDVPLSEIENLLRQLKGSSE